jgi:hypothetical protein
MDPFDLLHDQLVTAATATAPARAPKQPGRWHRTRWSRSLVLATAALAVSGTATAAVLTLTSRDSAPIRGTLSEPIGSGLTEARNYDISVHAGLPAGQRRWCSVLTLRGSDPAAGAGMTSCSDAIPGSPLITAGTLTSTTAGGRALSYAIVRADIARVRVGDVEIVTRSEPSLRDGWKAAVWTGPAEQASVPPVLLNADGAAVPVEHG